MASLLCKNEIEQYFSKNSVYKQLFTCDDEMRWLINNINKSIPFEMPDAYIEHEKYIYGIEHFRVSMYKCDNKGDISQKANGSKRCREKMSRDLKYEFEPSIDNLLKAIDVNLRSHSKSFKTYKENVLSAAKSLLNFRLVIFIEDTTDAGYIVEKHKTQPINPLQIYQLKETILSYTDIWGIFYSTGSDASRDLYGITYDELRSCRMTDETYDINKVAPFEIERQVTVSKTESTKDTNIVSLVLDDR